MPTNSAKRWTTAIVVVALLSAVPVVTTFTGRAAQADQASPGDGTTSATAGASCWGVKQAHPASGDGTYWLNTSRLQRPQQFHCDMTTGGGGWVLVARGRQGWSFNPLGQGSPATVRNPVSGPAAFGPAALPTATIDALLGGTALRDLPDGIRIERATNTTGTTRQDLRLYPKAAAWTWSLATGQLLDRVVIDGTTFRGSNTRDTAAATTGQTTNQLNNVQGVRRMFTWPWSSHANRAGFSFGTGVSGGSNSSTNHLWTNGNEGSPIPFTRVWLRPQIANDQAGFTPLPASGFPAEPAPVALKNRSEVAPWGVEGFDRSNEDYVEPWYTNVFALEDTADRMFVGGRFATVRNGPGGRVVNQRFLAAFDLDGQLVESFRPALDGRVWDMVHVDGKLLIAGDFTSVNGAPNTAGIAAIDPTTGATITTWRGTATHTERRPRVRALHLHQGTIYATGNFNRFQGADWAPINVGNAISFRASDGRPGGWRPILPAQGVDVRATTDGTRVLIGGYFDRVNGDRNHGYFAITDAATGAPIPGVGPWTASHPTGLYQQAVIDLGDGRIVTGGSQHSIHLYDWNRTRMLDSSITKQGGDTQAFEIIGDKVFFGCHCGDVIYQGTNSFATPTNFRSVDPINLVGAKDIDTWEYDTTWYPNALKGDRGEGIWAIEEDARQCVWVGGDLNRGRWSGNASADYLGGFARFCPEDVTPPTTPTDLQATNDGEHIRLQWGASTDAGGTVSYDVYKDDRPIATVWGTSFVDTLVDGSHRYTVRATDARGNRSAAPAPVTIQGAPPVISQPVAFGSTWRYLADGTDQATAWRAPSFDDRSWPAGAGKLGWGRNDLTTIVGATRPVTTYYRHTFQVPDAASVRMLELQLYNLQGAAIYVNGTEAGRLNLPAGALTATTGASGWLPAAEENTVKTVTIPGALLTTGTNTIAVEVHTVTANAGRSQFDLQATLYSANADATAPSAPTLTATPAAGSVALAWTPATDDVAIAGYQILRDGQPIAHTGPLATSWTDGTVDLASPRTYQVRAFDTNGNLTASPTVTISPQVDPNLLSTGATWRWRYEGTAPEADWHAPDFDDRAWRSGPAELGFGDRDEATVITDAAAPRPMTAYFRTTVELADPAAFRSVLASLIRDDGAVVYVNGVEVARDNLPAGPIEFATPAVRGITDRTEERTAVPFTIPASAFRAGTNTIAVEVHLNSRWSGDLSMSLRLTGQP